MLRQVGFVLCSLIVIIYGQQCNIPGDDYRLDCYPEPDATQNGCQARGCCWSSPSYNGKAKDSSNVPYCFFPSNFPSYQVKSLVPTDRGYKGVLYKQQPSFLPKEILNLNFEVIYETETRVRIRITDANTQRFEVPITLGHPDPSPPSHRKYEVSISPNSSSFSFEIKRRSDGLSLFKTFGPLLYSDQFIQISSMMATDHAYGMGEQDRPFLYKLSDEWTRMGLWNKDIDVIENVNLYGTHSFYLAMPNNGRAFGLYFFNSNAQEFGLQPTPAITYRTTGGILDIFVFTGGTPTETVQQYLQLIGKPMLPPFWSLGFQLSRWGYTNISHISNVLQRNLNISIPVEVQWSDIDYMDKYKDFTYDPVNYIGMGDFVKQIRQKYGVRYITIIDPAISNQYPGTYPPYDEGLQMNVFVRDHITNQPIIGHVWPGDTVFPDFTHPNASKYWLKQTASFYNSVPVDGLWIDMNEPSNFYNGSKSGCPGNSPLDNPFFTPKIRQNSIVLTSLCPSALHYNNIPHYNLHNLYAYTEAVVTNQVLLTLIPNKRVFLLTRSSFSGSGRFTFHWTGDNTADWHHLARSIPQIMNMNLFGIPMTGSDVCGFNSNTNEELCIRWTQLGAFYPFMRNHNTLGAIDQDPAVWSPKAQAIMRNIIIIRYYLIPHFYSLLVKSHLYGLTVMRPLSFEFYEDYFTHGIDTQFMVGPSVLVNPVLKPNTSYVNAYFPSGTWYDLNSFGVIQSSQSGQWLSLDAPIDKINVAFRGGHIITVLKAAMTTDLMRKNNFSLICALSENQKASGDLYWDDGESLDSYTGNKYTYVLFDVASNILTISPINIAYSQTPSIASIVLLGLNQGSIRNVTLNGISINFEYNANLHILEAATGNLSVTQFSTIAWN